jgi:amylosucrase
MKYFGSGQYEAKECDLAYNATQMALQWDMLATGDTQIMLMAQHDISQKPYGTSWIIYTRCHDDIGLGYDDDKIRHAGYDPYQHRKFLKDYYSGKFRESRAIGALFSVNPKTGDARLSGSLASLCGLEKAVNENDAVAIEISIRKILLMQAHSFFLGGIPMIFYGDELGYTNDYSYLDDPGKSYDNRWMHRPVIDWNKNKLIDKKGTIENRIFSATKNLIAIRRKLKVVADHKNLTWINSDNIHVAVYLRTYQNQALYGVFNFSQEEAFVDWKVFKQHGLDPYKLYDHWTKGEFVTDGKEKYLIIKPYGFHLFVIKQAV